MSERYEILGKLASGGIGVIYRAHDNSMGRDVAIKRLLPIEETSLNEAAASLKREASALARFQHPNVVTIFALEEDEEGPYVVTELIEGETLKTLVDEAAFTIDDFHNLVEQSLEPLVAAQAVGLLHRDLKPANIMIAPLPSGGFQVKILDFGLAKFSQAPSTQTLDQTGSFLGSIDYIAPEQIELDLLDQRTDLYALGCIFYYCLAQSPPFLADTPPKIMQLKIKGEPQHICEIRPDIPQPIGDWVMRMIERWPENRPQDATLALAEYQSAIRGETPAIVESAPVPVSVQLPDKPKLEISHPITPHATTRQNLIVGAATPQRHVTPGHTTGIHTLQNAQSVQQAQSDQQAPGPIRKKIGALPIVATSLTVVAALVIGLVVASNRGANEDVAPSPPSAKGYDYPEDDVANSPRTNLTSPPIEELKRIKNTLLPDYMKAILPPVKAGLIAVHASPHGATNFWNEDAELSDNVYAWRNFAPGANADFLLISPSMDPGRGPKVVSVVPSNYPSLKTENYALKFSREAVLSTGRVPSDLFRDGSGCTMITVARRYGKNIGALFHLAPTAQDPPVIVLNTYPGGVKSICHVDGEAHSIELPVDWQHYAVITQEWDRKLGEHRLHVYRDDLERASSPSAPAPTKSQPLTFYRIGSSPNPDPNTFLDAEVLYTLVYNRILTEAERLKVENYVHLRFFKQARDYEKEAQRYEEAQKLKEAQNEKSSNN